MHLFVVPIWFNLTFVSLVTLAAFVWGGWRERLVASVVCARWYIATAAYLWPSWVPFDPPPTEWRVAVSGVAIAMACLVGAVRGRSYWLIWASAFAILNVITDLPEVFHLGISHWASRSAARIWLYLMGAMILWGAWASHAERARDLELRQPAGQARA